MDDKNISMAMAKLDGYEFSEIDVVGNFVFTKNGNGYYLINYPHDFTAIHRVLKGLTKEERHKVAIEMGANWEIALTADEGQWCESILKATGLWV